MLISISPEAADSAIPVLVDRARTLGFAHRTLPAPGGGVTLGLDGDLPDEALAIPGVVAVHRQHRPYMLASGAHAERTVVEVGDVRFGGDDVVVIAGPCVIEGERETIEVARLVKAAGATVLRGGAFKPRTSPYAFQGLGEAGLQCLAAARDATGLPVVTEVLEPEQVDLVAAYADMLQIGARNMANTPLLRRAGETGKPVLLKRGFSATIEEWLLSAEYVLATGNPNVVLCERGIRGFDPATRFTLDLNAVPLVRSLSHLPIIVDPSHGTGKRELVEPMALAGLAAGADGLIVEVHPDPDGAKIDGAQTITPDALARIVRKGRALAAVLADEPLAVGD
jgi:3-deoxy-7-phosphoheptulonate synthase